MKIIILSIIVSTIYFANAKPMISIGADIPIPGIPAIPAIPRIPSVPSVPSIPGVERRPSTIDSDNSKADSSKEIETETMDKSESFYLGYSPYYYGGWPYYGYHYPYVYVG